MKVERKDLETGKIIIYSDQTYISRNACLDQEFADNPMEMIELKWWGKFLHLIKTNNNTKYIDATEWCKINSNGLVHTNGFMGMFYFELEEDALKFKLTWS